MERKHKVYLIISAIAYLLLCINFKIPFISKFSFLAYSIFSYLRLLLLIILLIIGIRNSIVAVVIWLGILFSDFLFHMNGTAINAYSLEPDSIMFIANFGLITTAIVFGCFALDTDTIDPDGFTKMFWKSAIVFFVCSILFHALISISSIRFITHIKDSVSEGLPDIIKYSIGLIVFIGVLGIAIYKTIKRKTFGFVFTAVLLVCHFFFYMSLVCSRKFSIVPVIKLRYVLVVGRLDINLVSWILLSCGIYIIAFLLIFSLILSINFLINLKRNPKLISIKDNENPRGER